MIARGGWGVGGGGREGGGGGQERGMAVRRDEARLSDIVSPTLSK